MKVKALKRHGYAGITRKQGTEFIIDNMKHVKLLVATKHVKIIENTDPRTVKKIEKQKEKVAVKTETKIKDRKVNKAKSGFYSRKDMIAVDNKSVDKKKKRI